MALHHMDTWNDACSWEGEQSVGLSDTERAPPKIPPLEKAMAPHSSTLAWKVPWTEEPGGLQSMGSLGVGHD